MNPRALLLRASVLSLFGCGPMPACAKQQSAAMSSSVSHDPGFEPPDRNGWGRVEGLRYLELIRGDARAEQPLPMLVLIHGLGDRPRRDWLDVIDLDVPARVVMPEAPTPSGDGYSWFTYRPGQTEPAELAREISAASEQLARALATLHARRPTLGRAIVTGFSQGGMLSFALALAHPDLVEQALPISGTLPEPLWPKTRNAAMRAPPIYALHGTADTIVPFEPTQRLVAHLRALGYDAKLRSFPGVNHEVARAMVPVIRTILTATARSLATARH